VALCLGGVGLWALPKDTPVVARPPVLVGWLVIGLGVLIIVVSMVTRSGYEVQPPLRRKSLPVKKDLPRAKLGSTPLPWPPPIPKPVERIYTDATPVDLLALGNTPNLTNAERARLLAPHLGKWLRIEGLVDEVNPQTSWVQVLITKPVADSAMPLMIAHFDSDLDRVVALRKGAQIRVAGKFDGLSVMNVALTLSDCELLN
jgi:hypothetical protein